MQNLKALGRDLLRRCGYRISPVGEPAPIDLRGLGNDPVALHYRGTATPVLVSAPFSTGRGLRTMPLDPDGSHPFIRAVAHCAQTDGEAPRIAEVLDRYYQRVQPASAREWLGLPPDADATLGAQPPWALAMPWDERSPDGWRREREKFALQENQAYGLNWGIEAGWHFWGPMDPEKAAIETQRLHRLFYSMETDGYHRHNGRDGDVRAVVLRKRSGEWRWQVAGGEHRAAVACALGFGEIPLRVIQLVHRDEVDAWPNVQAGVFSRAEALVVFDRIFDARPMPAAASWSALAHADDALQRL
jgi:hypothetical protein